MQRAPLIVPAISLVAGILAEQHGFTFAALALATAGCLTVMCRGAIVSAALAALIGVGASHVLGHPGTIGTERPTARYVALVAGDARPNADGTTSTALIIDGVGTIRTTLRERVVPGERIVVRGRLEPFDEPRNPGEPSMREIQLDDGFTARLAGARVLQRNGIAEFDVRAWPARLRAAASRIVRSRIPEPSATILAGALWGERGALPDDLHDAFQATGTVHVLVTAGLHLGVIAGLVTLLLARAGVGRVAACGIAIVVITAYAWFSGMHLPSERAAVMIGIALLARACGARVATWNAVALAAIVIALAWPVAVTSASFALSFSCICAIVLFAEPIAEGMRALPVHERIREALALTCATQIGTWPLTAAIFATLAPYAIVANAIVVPLVAVALTGGIATIAVPFAAPLETTVLLAMEHVVRFVAALPGARATIRAPSLTALITYDVLAFAAAFALQRGRTALAACAIAVGSALVIAPSFVPASHGLTITHLDVGQADAAVIRTPSGRTILIDAGGELEHGDAAVSSAERAGKRIVLAYLQREGIDRIDLMILTHPHGKHKGFKA